MSVLIKIAEEKPKNTKKKGAPMGRGTKALIGGGIGGAIGGIGGALATSRRMGESEDEYSSRRMSNALMGGVAGAGTGALGTYALTGPKKKKNKEKAPEPEPQPQPEPQNEPKEPGFFRRLFSRG